MKDYLFIASKEIMLITKKILNEYKINRNTFYEHIDLYYYNFGYLSKSEKMRLVFEIMNKIVTEIKKQNLNLFVFSTWHTIHLDCQEDYLNPFEKINEFMNLYTPPLIGITNKSNLRAKCKKFGKKVYEFNIKNLEVLVCQNKDVFNIIYYNTDLPNRDK